MRNTSLSSQEIEELDSFNKQQTRKTGLDLIPVKERGFAQLSNGAKVYWHHTTRDSEVSEDGIVTVASPRVPDNHFGIEFNGELITFNSEELRKWLRWA